MSVLSSIVEVATGGLGKQVVDLVKTYLPPDMSSEQKAQLQIELDRIALDREKAANEAMADAEKSINERIAAYEGTAADLKAIPILGSLMIFARGAQRPVWGFATLWLDYQWFTVWTALTEQQQAALYVINFLVLGFLFGERAVKNVAPFVTEALRAGK